jgi:hypothetical protein
MVGQIPLPLASRPCGYCCGEIDRYPPTAGKEGDPLLLGPSGLPPIGIKKKLTFPPTIKGLSRIEVEFEHSTQKYGMSPARLRRVSAAGMGTVYI